MTKVTIQKAIEAIKNESAPRKVSNSLENNNTYRTYNSTVGALNKVLRQKFFQNGKEPQDKENFIVSGALQRTIGSPMKAYEKKEYALQLAAAVMKHNIGSVEHWLTDKDAPKEKVFYMPIIPEYGLGDVGTAIEQNAVTGAIREIKCDTIAVCLKKEEEREPLGFSISYVQPKALNPEKKYTNRDLTRDLRQTREYNQTKNEIQRAFYRCMVSPNFNTPVQYRDDEYARDSSGKTHVPTIYLYTPSKEGGYYELRKNINDEILVGRQEQSRKGLMFKPSDLSRLVGPRKKVIDVRLLGPKWPKRIKAILPQLGYDIIGLERIQEKLEEEKLLKEPEKQQRQTAQKEQKEALHQEAKATDKEVKEGKVKKEDYSKEVTKKMKKRHEHAFTRIGDIPAFKDIREQLKANENKNPGGDEAPGGRD